MDGLKIIDSRKVEDLVRELNDGHQEDLSQFSANHSSVQLEIMENIAKSYRFLMQFDQIDNPDDRIAHVVGHLKYCLDALFTSTKLLAMGYLVPSGNMFRQSIEAACMAVLLTHPGQLKKGSVKAQGKQRREEKLCDYYEDYAKSLKSPKANKRKLDHVKTHRAVQMMEMNVERLGLNKVGLDEITKAKGFYNMHSHASPFSIASRYIKQGEKMISLIGAKYNEVDDKMMKGELEGRRGYSEVIAEFVQITVKRVKANLDEYKPLTNEP